MQTPGIIIKDPWLKPFQEIILNQEERARQKEKELTGDKKLVDFATGYLFFGLHKTKNSWIFREWALNARKIYIIGDFTNWEENEEYRLTQKDCGNWEIKLQNLIIFAGLIKSVLCPETGK
ncbi:hypothetical protein ES705_18826 [subsurface metagenome]